LLIGGSSLGGWNLNYVRRCRIWILIVWIIIGWRYRYGVVRPPEWTVDASDNYSTQKSSEYGPSWRKPAVIVPAVAAIIMSSIIVASARVSAIPATCAPSMKSASGMTT
jgi:hypothetical protein